MIMTIFVTGLLMKINFYAYLKEASIMGNPVYSNIKGIKMKKFSLMELLVVIGILLLMMSLLLPVVGPMLNRAELNKTVTTIIGQLEVGHLKSLEKGQVTRVSFEYDPKGKSLSKTDVTTITGMSATTDSDEFLARQSYLANREFDINNDGVAGGYTNRQFFWMKFYLCPETFINGGPKNGKTEPFVKDIKDALGNNLAQGPFWMRRPISRVKNNAGNFVPTKMNAFSMRVVDEFGAVYYYRPVKNDGLDFGGDEKLMQIEADGTFYLINDNGSILPYNLTIPDIKTYAGGCNSTYDNSVAIYKSKNGYRYTFLFGAAIDAYYLGKPPAEQNYDISTEWFDIFEGDYVEAKSIDYGNNDDEDKLIDEGMSVSVEAYNQSGFAPAVRIPVGVGPNEISSYNIYFNSIEDNHLKLSREYFIGGKDRKGVMLRRVWGEHPTKPGKVLLWSFDKIITPGGNLAKANMRTSPYYFYITFDQKNGDSGMSFCSSFGSVQVGKLYFQISDDDAKFLSIVEFSDGIAKEGNVTEMGFPNSKAGLDAIDFYQGIK
jgi:hypothetical protein